MRGDVPGGFVGKGDAEGANFAGTITNGCWEPDRVRARMCSARGRVPLTAFTFETGVEVERTAEDSPLTDRGRRKGRGILVTALKLVVEGVNDLGELREVTEPELAADVEDVVLLLATRACNAIGFATRGGDCASDGLGEVDDKEVDDRGELGSTGA